MIINPFITECKTSKLRILSHPALIAHGQASEAAQQGLFGSLEPKGLPMIHGVTLATSTRI